MVFHDFRNAASFLTRVPLHPRDGANSREFDLARVTPWFPGVGTSIGVFAAVVHAVLLKLLPPGPASALTLAATALLTGAFHQDGLADIADAFGGGWNTDERLAILKDSRHGTYAVVTLVINALVQWSALASLSATWAAAALISANTIGRCLAVVATSVLRPATSSGLGATARSVKPASLATAVVFSAAIALMTLGPWGLGAISLASLGGAFVLLLASRKIGGYCGDVLGAVEQVGESLVLVFVSSLVFHHCHLPWGLN